MVITTSSVSRVMEIVGPAFFTISDMTDVFDTNDIPKSPLRTFPNHLKNWMAMGSFSPRVSRTAATSSIVASTPTIDLAASPGITRSSTNTRTATTSNIGNTASIRLTR